MPRGEPPDAILAAFFSDANFSFPGKFTNHKGRNRRFTNPEELEAERKQEEAKKWRKKKGLETSDTSDDEEAAGDKKINEEGSSSEEESDSDDVRVTDNAILIKQLNSTP